MTYQSWDDVVEQAAKEAREMSIMLLQPGIPAGPEPESDVDRETPCQEDR